MTKEKISRKRKVYTGKKTKTNKFIFKNIFVLALASLIILPQALLPMTISAETAPLNNPEIIKTCGLDIVLVLDNSSSIDTTEITKEKNAFISLIDSLSGTPTEYSVISFGTKAQIKGTFTNDIQQVKNAINTINYDDWASTNWQDALIKAQNTLPNRNYNQNLVIFASDGNPTINNDDLDSGNSPINGNDWSKTDRNDLENSITAANAIKASGTRIITLGIGADVTQQNLQKISSADAYWAAADFNALGTILRNLANNFCGGTITVTKKIGLSNNWTPAQGWTFNIGGQSNKQTDDNGQTEAVELTNGTYNVVETAQTGYALTNAACVITNANSGDTPIGTPDIANNQVKDISINTNNIISCTFYNQPICQKIYGALTCTGDGSGTKSYTWSDPVCGNPGTENVTDPACACNYSAWGNAQCASDGMVRQTRTQITAFAYCTAPLQQDTPDPFCTCVETDTPGACVSDGTKTHTYTYNQTYCGATHSDPVTDASCACVETPHWSCTGPNASKTTYTFNQAYCIPKSDLINPTDENCPPIYDQCDSWANTTCANAQQMTQTRICKDQYGNPNPGGPENQTIADPTCACVYSDWTDTQCASDGMMRQTRTQTTAFAYCIDSLEQTVANPACACAENDTPGACVSNGFKTHTYTYNQSYCNQTHESSIPDTACNCAYSDWVKTGCSSSGLAAQTRTQITAFNYCADPLTQTYADDSCNQTTTVCGNSILETGETCDNGAGGNGTACTAAYGQTCDYCTAICAQSRVTGPYCGDNIVNGAEQCDGTTDCNSDCTKKQSGSQGSSSGSGSTSGDWAPGYGPNAITPQVKGASTQVPTLEELEKQLDNIRRRLQNLINIIDQRKSVLGQATEVNTGIE